MRILWKLLGATAIAVPCAAGAQAQDDGVVVMRRVLAPPQVSRDANGYDQNQYHWETGAWQAAPSCESTVEQTRTVTCVRRNAAQPDASCTQARPDDRRTVANTATCGHEWIYTAWSDTPSCGSVTNTRTAVCKRSDGLATPGACDIAKREPLSETVYDTRDCSYSWKPGEWGDYTPSTCSDAATRTRAEACVRSDNQVVDAVQCAGKTHNALSEGPAGVYSGCTHSWSYGPWVSASTCSTSTTQTRTATCMRTINGQQVPVDESWCAAEPKVASQDGITDTSSCSTAWTYSPWVSTAPVSTCTQNQAQTRTATCTATIPSGGTAPVADSRCDVAARQNLTQTVDIPTGCSWAWNPNDGAVRNWTAGDTTTGWTAWSNSCGAATRTRTVQCKRSDGKIETGAGTAKCTGTMPADEQISTQTSDCGGQLVDGGFESGTLSNWTAGNTKDSRGVGVAPTIATDRRKSGSYSVAFPSTNQGNGPFQSFVTQTFPTKAGAVYAVSAWAYCFGAYCPTMTALSSTNAVLASVSFGNSDGGGIWLQKSFNVTGTGTPITIRLMSANVGTSLIRMDDVVVGVTPP